MENPEWTINEELYSKLNSKVLESILHDGKDRFNAIVGEIQENRKRAFTILAILLSFIGFLISASVNQISGISKEDYNLIYLLIVFGLIVTLCSIYMLLRIIYPKERMEFGEEPQHSDFEALASIDLENQEFMYLINDIEQIQGKISFNEKALQFELKILEYLTYTLPTVYIILLLISLIVIICK